MADKLYFTRHGETFWNVENKICGATDIALTPKGRAQAAALGQRLQSAGLPIDLVLASPLSRAAETARILAEAAGLPLQIEPRLTEQNFGIFEGTPRNGAAFRAAKAHFVNRFGSGESMMQMAARIYPLLDELRRSGKTCLLVAHNGIARVVHSYFFDMTNEQYAAFGIGNCELREYDFR
ncbi:histidine phosphatase family protein [uncultured Gemmiger sp.]|uniref:histidine phosphatase family protein n=1 Tax=uncultured Gemmiger sp. TaxID=1623490 RepID=UPI0025FA439B|nr:histidine phosphatase family protein [uncultured Gemmiger sp.]